MAVQSILPLRNFYYNPLIQIHLFKKQAVGNLKRPFINATPFSYLYDFIFSKQTAVGTKVKKQKIKSGKKK